MVFGCLYCVVTIFFICSKGQVSSGGSHAGLGGQRFHGLPYDNILKPVLPGEGGGPPPGQAYLISLGGGILHAIARQLLVNKGEISSKYVCEFMVVQQYLSVSTVQDSITLFSNDCIFVYSFTVVKIVTAVQPAVELVEACGLRQFPFKAMAYFQFLVDTEATMEEVEVVGCLLYIIKNRHYCLILVFKVGMVELRGQQE